MVAVSACVLSHLTRPGINGSNLIPVDESFALDCCLIHDIKGGQLENGSKVKTTNIKIGLFYHVFGEINGFRTQACLFCQEFSDGLESGWSWGHTMKSFPSSYSFSAVWWWNSLSSVCQAQVIFPVCNSLASKQVFVFPKPEKTHIPQTFVLPKENCLKNRTTFVRRCRNSVWKGQGSFLKFVNNINGVCKEIIHSHGKLKEF